MNRTITSFALLSTNYTQKKEYIDIFIPFFAELFHTKKYKQIELEYENIINDFNEMYGLKLPRNALITLLNRCAKKGILKRENNLYTINNDIIKNYYSTSNKAAIERNIKAILHNIKDYIKNEFGREEDLNDIEYSLLNILTKYDSDILLAVNHSSVIPKNNFKASKLEYMVYSYILEAEQKRPQDIKYIIELVTGHILAETILHDNFDSIKAKMKNITIYLDTPLLIDLLGYSGEFKKLAIKELIGLLQEQSAKICIFDLTLNELKTIIYNCYISLDKNNYDINKAPSILRYCNDNNISPLIVYELYTNIENKLQNYNIHIIQHPNLSSNINNVIDGVKLENTIKDIYTAKSSIESIRQETLNIDVQVLTCIYFLSGDNRPKHIGECKHILITSNFALAKSCKIFESSEFKINEFIPACVTAIFMGTLLWLQSPQKSHELNKLKFIGDCYSALQPDNEFIDKFMDELNKLEQSGDISSESISYIRSKSFINDFYRNIYGDYDDIQQDNIRDLYVAYEQRIIKNATEPIAKKLENTQLDVIKLKEQNKALISKKIQRNKENFRRVKKNTNIISLIIWVPYVLILVCGIIYLGGLDLLSLYSGKEFSFFKISSSLVIILSYVGLVVPTYRYYKKFRSFLIFKLFKRE